MMNSGHNSHYSAECESLVLLYAVEDGAAIR